MSYDCSLYLRNIIPFEKGESIIKFNENRNILLNNNEKKFCGWLFYDTSLAKYIEVQLKKRGNWDNGSDSIMGEFILFNYWDIIPDVVEDNLERVIYKETRTFKEYTGRKIILFLNNFDEEDNTKYLLITRFIHRERILEAPTQKIAKRVMRDPWNEKKQKIELETSFIYSKRFN